jgi:hypothetical protein
MALEEYRDPILQKLIDMFEEHGPEELKGHYIQGDVLYPNQSDLPVVSVMRDMTNAKSDGTMQDVHRSAIEIAIIVDATADYDMSFDLTRGTTTLYRLVEERDDTYAVKEGSMLHALRASQKLDNNLFISIKDDGVSIDYASGWEKRGHNIFSVEGILRFEIELTQPKPNMS